MHIKEGDIFYANMPYEKNKFLRPIIIVKVDSRVGCVYAVPLTHSLTTFEPYTVMIMNFINGQELLIGVRCDNLLRLSNDDLRDKAGNVSIQVLTKITKMISNYFNYSIKFSMHKPNTSDRLNSEYEIDKESEIVLNNNEDFLKIMQNVNELATQYKKNNSNTSIWKERLINGFIGFVFGIITSLIFLQF